MGSDMTAIIEKRTEAGWVPAEKPNIFIYDDPDPQYMDMHYELNDKIVEPEGFLIARNRVFFNAISDWHSEYYLNPIAPESRGLPQDLSPELSDYLQRMCKYNNKTFSWVTLEEIVNANWDKKLTKEKGYVEKYLAPLFGDGNQKFPDEKWPENANLKYELTGEQMKKGEYEEVTWLITYTEAIGEDYVKDVITRLSLYGEPENVRMLFEISH